MKTLIIYVDYWCPLCLRFAKYLEGKMYLIKFKEDIRNCLDQKWI